jgi:fructokinase
LNLRPPHYSREVVKYLLQQADLVKLNEDELTVLMEGLGQPTDAATALPWLAKHFGLQAVCLTLGAAGASLYAHGTWHHRPAAAVAVKNPIGYGDAFLAALLTGWATDRPPSECLRRACAVGAAVASRPGAAPAPPGAELQALLAGA